MDNTKDEVAPLLDSRIMPGHQHSGGPLSSADAGSVVGVRQKERVFDYENTWVGMGFVLVATFVITSVSAIVSYYDTPVLETMLGRYLIQHLMAWSIWWFFKNNSNKDSGFHIKLPQFLDQSFDDSLLWYGNEPYRRNVWTRGCLYWLLVFSWWNAIEYVPIGNANCIVFTSPILTMLVARIYLKEALPNSFIFTSLLSISGAVLVSQPEFVFGSDDDDANVDTISTIGVVFLLLVICCDVGIFIMIRSAKQAHWLQLELVSSFIAGIALTPFVIIITLIINVIGYNNDIFDLSIWEFNDTMIFVWFMTAVLGFIATMCLVVGFQCANATKVAFFQYFELPFSYIFQIYLFNEIPNEFCAIGIALIVLSCVVHASEEYYVTFYGSNSSNNGQLKSDESNHALLPNNSQEYQPL